MLKHFAIIGAIFVLPCNGWSQAPPVAAFKQGVINYRISFPSEPAGRPREVRLAWDETAVRIEWNQLATNSSPPSRFTVAVLGRDALTYSTADSVTFSRELPDDYSGNPKYNLVPRRPSMPLGVRVPGFPVIKSVDGKLTEAADSGRPNPFTKWTYEGTVDSGAGQVAHSAVMTSSTGTVVKYEILSARLGSLPPREILVPEWYRKGMSIVDLRVNPPVNWTYEKLVQASGKKSGLTPDELLILSQSISSDIGRSLDARKRNEESQNAVAWLMPTLTIAGVFALILGYGLWRRSMVRP